MAPIGEIKRTPADICEFEWRIPDFVSLSTEHECCFSPPFLFAGESCRLSIAPNGIRRQHSDGYIGLYLTKKNSNIKFEVSLGIKTSDGGTDRERLYAKYDIRNNVDMYGIPRCLLRSELLQKQSELLPSNVLTVICTVKYSKSALDVECSYCEKSSDPESFSSHEKKCKKRPIRCPECSADLLLQDWYEHVCPPIGAEGGIAFAKCSYCEKTLLPENVSSHEKKCTERLITCTKCCDAVLLLDWYNHKCQARGAKVRGIIEIAECRYCRKTVKAENILVHEKKCVNKSIICPECSDAMPLKNWFDHECQAARALDETLTQGPSVVHHENKLMLDYKKLFLKKEDCDVVIKVKEQEFHAHKLILEARSPVLASTFRSDMKEKATGQIEIEDCDPSYFTDFLCFLYCGDMEVISQENVFSLYMASDKYDVQDLKARCLIFMKENISVDTFCDTISLALRHCETDLIKLASDFFTKNASDIVLTVKWQVFLAENPTQSNELLVKLLKPDASLNK